MLQTKKEWTTKTMVLCAVLTAIVIVLQFLGATIKLGPFSISLVLLPIVIGATTCGVGAGAWLGLIFGAVVLLTDSAAFLAINVPGTVITVLLKGVLSGFAAGIVYQWLQRYHRYFAVIAAAIVCPVVNTGIFLLGCLAFFMEAIQGWAAAAGLDSNVAGYMIFTLVGANFLFEIASNMILSPVIVRLLNFKRR